MESVRLIVLTGNLAKIFKYVKWLWDETLREQRFSVRNYKKINSL